MKRILSIIALVLLALAVRAQNISNFKLPNGLTVYICEDPTQHDVFGEVVVRTGSVNDPQQYTGLAHYLEHVMFKGTTRIGALDWEAEKPLYEQIIAKYDEYSETSDESRRAEISGEINELTVKEGEISISQEYSNLIESIGGNNLNAGTSYDYTVFYNTFPANETAKWLMLSSERFINPVFRAFQSELETVYEEYNMYADDPQSQVRNFFLSKAFEGTPYAREVIGLGEHLKNPKLSRLIEFYEEWYVPSNMALIIAGNVSAKNIQRLILSSYGRLPARQAPVQAPFELKPVSGRSVFSTKCSYYPSTYLVFNGVPNGHPDEVALDLTVRLLSNSSETGTLDKLAIDGLVMGAGADMAGFNRAGRIVVMAVPYYDESQHTYDSNKKVESLLLSAVRKLAEGDIDAQTLESVKINMLRDYDLSLESNEGKVNIISSLFLEGKDLSEIGAYRDKVNAVTVDDIRRLAGQYLKDNYIVINNEIGSPDQGQKIRKPDYKPVDPPVGKSSAFAQSFKNLKSPEPQISYVDWNSVRTMPVNSYSKLYYSQNPSNDIYTLVLRFGANCKIFPQLEYSASLMNNAGVLANFTSHQLKEEFARLGATCSIDTDDDYLYVTLRGYDATLKDACLLVTKLILLPSLDEKQLGNLKGSIASSRFNRKNNVNVIADALEEYVKYGDESPYRLEITDSDVINMDISKLTATIAEAKNYAAQIHYSGNMPFEQVASILSSNLPLVENEKPSSAPYIRPMKEYTENTVFFVPNSGAKQAKIIVYVPMGDYDRNEEAGRIAFNQYFSGGFNGLVMQEIREKNSMAYSAYGVVQSSKLPGSRQYLGGFLETQNDKALDALRLFTSLLNDMPRNADAASNIRNYLKQTLLFQKPGPRALSLTIASWEQQGLSDDPAKTIVPVIENLTFDDIVRYYEKFIKGRPVAIGIVGDPQYIKVKDLAAFGKVVRLNNKNLFNETDVRFQ